MWEFDPSDLVAIPHQQKDQLLALRAANCIWIFARQNFVPSTWLLLKREGFSGDLVTTSKELTVFGALLGAGSINKVMTFYHGQQNNYWTRSGLISDFEELVLSQRIQVYKLHEKYTARLADPEDRFYSSNTTQVDAIDYPVIQLRLQLAQNLGQEIRHRWQAKVAADSAHFNLSYFDREYAEWSETVSVVADAGWGALKGLFEAVSFVVNFAVDAVKSAAMAVHSTLQGLAQFQENMQTAVIDALNGKNAALLDQLKALGMGVANTARDVAQAAKNIAHKMAEKLKEGKRLFDLIMQDVRIRELLWDYIDSLGESMKYMDSRNAGLKVLSTLVFEIGIDVLLGLATMGTAVVAKRAGQLASKASKLSKDRFGPFSAKAMGMLADLARLLDSKQANDGPSVSQSKLDIPSEAKTQQKTNSTPRRADNEDRSSESEGEKTSENNNLGTNQGNQKCPKDAKTCTGGEPISLVTGEEILGLTDFTINGVYPLPWVRKYKSSNSSNSGMGIGWTHPFSEKLVRTPFGIALHTNEARIIPFAKLSVGGSTTNKSEKLALIRNKIDAYTLLAKDGREVKQFDLADGDRFYPTRVGDGLGNGLSLVYNPQCQLKEVVADSGARWQLHYQGNNLAEVQWHSETGQNKTLASYKYNDDNDLIAAFDAQGNCERYRYINHIIQQRTLKSGYNFHFKWTQNTPRGRCVRNWGDHIDGLPTYDYQFNWQTDDNAVEITDTRGGVEYYQFNEAGLPLLYRNQEGGETRYQYDSWGNVTQVTDPLGRQQRYQYDDQQCLIKSIDATGQTAQFKRDGQGNVVETTDHLGQRWRNTYTANGLIASQTNPLGESFYYSYNGLGLPKSITNPLGQSWHYLWDNLGQLTAIRNPLGQHTRYKRSGEGLVEAIIQPDGTRTRYQYDNNGNCIAIESPDGKRQEYQYNGLGLLTEHKTADGRATAYHYNGLSQVVKRVDSQGHSLHYQYDGERNLVGLTNQNGEQYQLKYDLNERLVEEIGFDGRTQRYQYDAAGQLSLSEDICPASGQCMERVRYQRNQRGQLLEQWLEVHQGQANNTLLKQFQYDNAGRLIAANNSAQSLTWAYDALGRPTQVVQGQHIIHHQYDALGRRTASQLPDGNQIDYQFDEVGLLNQVSLNGQMVAQIGRDQLGRETQRLHGNQLTSEQNYDPQGRLQRQALYKTQAGTGPADTVNQRKYHYNAAGQLSQIDDQRRGTTHYHYDSIDRLVKVSGPQPETFVHDPAGNLLGNEPSQNDSGQSQNQRNHNQQSHSQQSKNQQGEQITANRLNFYADCHYQYDERGNRISQRRGKAGKLVTHYHYNGLNELTKVEANNSTTHYQYDALGRRVSKTLEHKGQTSHTQFLWNDDVLLSEQTTAGTVDQRQSSSKTSPGTSLGTKPDTGNLEPVALEPENLKAANLKAVNLKAANDGAQSSLDAAKPNPAAQTSAKLYLFEPGTFKPLAFVEQGQIYHYHLDHLGTPQEISNNQGNLVWSANYKAYGSLALADTQQVENNLRFQGQYFDEETGLHYNRFRYYDPEVGRFTQQDPIGLLGGVNNYQYVPNPVTWVDPLGLSCKEELEESVLDESNLLGKGYYKEAYIIDESTVFLTPKVSVPNGAPHTMEALKREAFLLDYLKNQHDLPVMKFHGVAKITKADGAVVDGLVAERLLFNGKDVDSIRKGNNPQGLTLADVYDSITPESLKEMERIKEIVLRDKVVVKDLQFMFGKDGMPVISDPLDAYSGKYSDQKGLDDTVEMVDSHIIMIKNILKNKGDN